MAQFQSYFTHHAFGFWIGLLIVLLLLSGAVIVQLQQIRRRLDHYDDVLRATESGNIPGMLAEYLNTARQVSQRTDAMESRVSELAATFPTLIRHVGLVRFSPFHDTGGDQSFALALLDSRGDGIVMSALHSRHDHKLYAKPVLGRSSSYPLTKEEEAAIKTSIDIGITADA